MRKIVTSTKSLIKGKKNVNVVTSSLLVMVYIVHHVKINVCVKDITLFDFSGETVMFQKCDQGSKEYCSTNVWMAYADTRRNCY